MTTTFLAAIPSPAQGVWQLGPVPLRAYALCIIVGIVAALVIGDRRWDARGGERGVIYDIALWAVPFGLIGGRLYHVITDWWRYFGDNGAGLAGVFRIWDGGLGIWGAVALGGVGAWIACRRRGIPLPAFGDAIAPGIILAQGIGRLGNYFNQELFGSETTLPWALKIYERRDSAGMIDNLNGVSTGEVVNLVHPTFLYELLWNLLIFAVLLYVDRRFKFGHGRLFALYVAGYCVGRFWIELLRTDDATLIEGVRINSFTATFVFIGAVVYIMAAPKGREDPATLKGKARGDWSPAEEITGDLAAIAATTGVVAAAKAAADEDGKTRSAFEAETLTADVAEGEVPTDEDVSAEELGADVAGVPAESVEEAEEFATEGDESAADAEAVAEADALANEVAAAPAEDIAEAEEFAEAGEAADAGGIGAVEGEEASDALVDAAEAHESAVEGEAVAEELADDAVAKAAPDQPVKAKRRLRMWPRRRRKAEVEAVAVAGADAALDETPEDEAPTSDAAPEASGEAEAVAEAEALAGDVALAPSGDIAEAEEFAEAGENADVGGVGAVEGEEASDALADAAEA
ncbi:prolipoprotein diacylglyceryl transferase, partial [Mycolicibacterium sp. GF69]|uniref:prolipoprotein diacylglyceryl transferase n=1 Tax=Mycolicibacterium sp. GF69 TaxID=2267251 RepID=UPI001F0BBFDD